MGQKAKIPDCPVHYQPMAMLSDLPKVPWRGTDGPGLKFGSPGLSNLMKGRPQALVCSDSQAPEWGGGGRGAPTNTHTS